MQYIAPKLKSTLHPRRAECNKLQIPSSHALIFVLRLAQRSKAPPAMLGKLLSAIYHTDRGVWQSVTAIYHGYCCIYGYKLFNIIVQAT